MNHFDNETRDNEQFFNSSISPNLKRFIAGCVLIIAFCLTSFLTGCGGGGTTSPDNNPPIHILSYGQSLSLGSRAVNNFPSDNSLPATPPNLGFMFNTGILAIDETSIIPFQQTILTDPDTLATFNITSGETPLTGVLMALVDYPGIKFASAAGRGGTNLLGLSKGTAPYARLLAQVQNAHAALGTMVPAILWLQGESDAGNPLYIEQFAQLVADLRRDVPAITGQDAPPDLYLCLTAAPDIAQAQRKAASTLPGVHISCDTATLAHSDGTHLTAASSRLAGLALGRDILAQLLSKN